MKPKKIPMRMCAVTREKWPKKELIRVVRTPEGNVIVDETSKANGRGIYLKRDLDVILKAQKTKILERQLEVKINEEVYEELKQMVG